MKLTKDEIVTMEILRRQGETNQQIAQRLGISEGAVRYQLKRQATLANGTQDGRSKQSLIEKLGLVQVVEAWWQDQLEQLAKDRSPNVQLLWAHLVDEYQFSGSSRSVYNYVREHFPALPKRPFRRVETPPAAQVQSDWLEMKVRLRDAVGVVVLATLYGFIMTLSHSRKVAVIWSQSMDQLAWHRVHNEAFRRLGGIAAINRIDNLKTGVSSGSGAWGQINSSYAAYARTMGFHVDPHEARQPQQKGKVERRVGVFKRLDFRRIFNSVAELQSYTDETLQRDSVVRICPVTGLSVHATWLQERELLRPLPGTMPEPFDLIKQASVHKDCTIRFEGRTNSVPYRFANKTVEVRGCSQIVQIVDPQNGQIIKEFPRKTVHRLLIDQDCYEPTDDGSHADCDVPRPLPLGNMAKRIEELASQGVAQRSIDFYAAIAEQKAQAAST